MSTQTVSRSIGIGGVTAASTTGALIAMGHRLGSSTLPFAAIGASLLHQTVSGVAADLIVTGLVLHVVAMILWSAAFVWFTRQLEGRDVIAALGTTLVAFFVSWLVTEASSVGVASVLPIGDFLVLALVFAASLVVGMRLAFPSRATDERHAQSM